MRFWPFGKEPDKPNEEPPAKEVERIGGSEISLMSNDSPLDIELYEHKSFGEDAIGGTAFIDAVIPAAGAAVDAVAQYGHAIVRFPEGANWGDLLNRKTPGWEGFKQLGILKDGKFQPQAAIKQAKLQPAAVGNLALQGAAMVVGQIYMVEINKQLEEVTAGISAIQEDMRLERESDIAACMEMLKEYSEDYMAISDSPTDFQAARDQIEAIRREARAAWIFQVNKLRSLEKSLRKSGKMKNEELEAKMRDFALCDKSAHDAFVFLMAAEQVKMQYSQSYSTAQIKRERDSIQSRMLEYAEIRNAVQEQLLQRINKMHGKTFAIPAPKVEKSGAVNPIAGAGKVIKDNAPRVFPPNMRKEAKRQRDEKRASYGECVSKENLINDVADSRIATLDDIDFIYNQADMLLIDESGIHYLRGASPDEEVSNGSN